MAKEKGLKCDWCDEEIKEGDFWAETKKGEILCEGCWQTAWEDACTLAIFRPDGSKEVIRFCEEFGTEEGGDYPYPVKRVFWVKTDAWRGYFDWELEPEMEVIADGWTTGYPDETTTRKVDLNEILEKLDKGLIIPPVPIYWLFGRTSNVFSTSIKVAVAKGDVEAIDKWLREVDGGIEGLQRMAW